MRCGPGTAWCTTCTRSRGWLPRSWPRTRSCGAPPRRRSPRWRSWCTPWTRPSGGRRRGWPTAARWWRRHSPSGRWRCTCGARPGTRAASHAVPTTRGSKAGCGASRSRPASMRCAAWRTRSRMRWWGGVAPGACERARSCRWACRSWRSRRCRWRSTRACTGPRATWTRWGTRCTSRSRAWTGCRECWARSGCACRARATGCGFATRAPSSRGR